MKNKGGHIASNGYKIIYVGKDHHLADVRGYAYEHRLNAEIKIGRKLRKGEQVHHIDEIKLNNNPDNLEVVKSMRHHRFLHRKNNEGKIHPDEENTNVFCGCGCGGEFLKYDASGRLRTYITGHNPQNSKNQDLVFELIKSGVIKTMDIINVSGLQKKQVAPALCTLKKKGLIVNKGHGVYELQIRQFPK